jgi:hypothetical protein
MAEAVGVGRLWRLRDEIVGALTRSAARQTQGFAARSASGMQKSGTLNKSLFLL